MDVIKQPSDPNYIGTIHLHGDLRDQELREVNGEERRDWERKIVVDDVQFRTHRCLPRTELNDKGNKSSNALSKLEDILKDPPQKYSLRERELRLDKVPALSTLVGAPGKSRHKGDEEHGSYKPGPFEERSWLMEKNRIPFRSDLEERSKDAKDEDFKLVFREKTVTSRRPIEPLLPHERNNDLFASSNSPS